MNEQQRQLALDINALLMAFHTEDSRALKSVVNDSDEPVDLLLGSIAVLMNMIEELLSLIERNVDDMEVDFETLIQIRGELITEDSFGEE